MYTSYLLSQIKLSHGRFLAIVCKGDMLVHFDRLGRDISCCGGLLFGSENNRISISQVESLNILCSF